MPPLSLYIHFPWCLQKCFYCDFNSHALKNTLPEITYIDTLLCDLQNDLQRFSLVQAPLHSIFMGGGTPSLFSPDALARLLNGIKPYLAVTPSTEITLEANPGAVDSYKFVEFRSIGINRLSIGVQTFDDIVLKRLGRIHNAQEARRAITLAQEAGFTNLNIDLMFGLPTTDAHISYNDIQTALALQPSHISFYQLTLEPNTLFYKYPPALPDEELINDSQQNCQQLLAEHGFNQYEISAYSQINHRCQHNVNYWQFGDYLGIGAGAHGKITRALPHTILRSSKAKHPEHYLRDFRAGSALSAISVAELPLEFLMNQLRLKSGFTAKQFYARTGLSLATLEPMLSQCLQQNLLEYQNKHYRCTPQGWQFLDSILERFVTH